MSKTRSFPLILAAALIACALLPTSALAISRETVLARGRVWLKAVRGSTVGVPYSQSRWALENGAPTAASTNSTPTVGYRTDCSGFASMCLNLRDSRGRPVSTSTYEMGRNQSSLFKLTAIKKSELQPGDLMLKSTVWYTGSGGGHVIIFAGWANSAQSEYWALEQTTPGTKYSKRPYGQSGYRAFRYSGIDGFSRSRVNYGGTFTAEGTAYRSPNASGSVVASSGVVDLGISESDGSFRVLISSSPVDLKGHYKVTYAPTKTARFAIRYRSQDVSNQSTILPATTITVAPNITGVSVRSSKLKRGRTYTFSGYVNPRVSTTLKIYKYSTRSHTYRLHKSVRGSLASGKSGPGYRVTARWKPRASGRYRLVWLTAAPAGMTYATSATRSIIAK